jgi:hypothetical protein
MAHRGADRVLGGRAAAGGRHALEGVALDRWTATGLALVLGGAAGNLFDRIVWGRVTDFLEFYIGDSALADL